MALLTLDAFPEELLERILALALPTTDLDARPLWLRSPTRQSTRLAPLLTSRQLTRIATPLLYHSIHLPTSTKASLLLRTLRARPALAAQIRCLSLGGVWRDAAETMSLCSNVRVLDITINFEGDDLHTDELFGEALKGLTGIRHLTMRKPTNVYISLPRPRSIINALASAIPHWPNLRTADIAFKLSDDTPTSPITAPSFSFSPFALPPTTTTRTPPTPAAGPVSLLASALSSAPRLHTLTTHLPSVWNAAILAVSLNPHLSRIILVGARPLPAAPAQGIVGTGLFLMEARRHARLVELIKAGTPIMRSRAHTVGTPSPSPSPPLSSLAAGKGVEQAGMPVQKLESGVGLGLGLSIDMSGSRSRSPVQSVVCPSWLGQGKGKGKGKGKARCN